MMCLMIKEIKPSVRNIPIYSDCCNSKSSVFFTNEEIFRNTTILQWCCICEQTSSWRM